MTEHPAPAASCWLTDAVVETSSKIEGSGLIATRPIAAGDPVMRFGGELLDDAELASLMASSQAYVDTLSVYEGVNLVMPRMCRTTLETSAVTRTLGGLIRS